MTQWTFIDLFSGIGSFHYALKQLGCKCVLAADISEAANQTYFINYQLQPMGDITQIEPADIPNHHILCAGFPCQPFSQIGHRRGFADQRGSMIDYILDILTAKHPMMFILENVPSLKTHRGGTTFQDIVERLTDVGYVVSHKILSCKDFGIPQLRKRLFIVGSAAGECDLSFPDVGGSPTLSQYLNRNFERDYAYTIRCGGRRSPMNDKHNWDGYWVDGNEYRLTIADCLKLQGFPDDFLLSGSETAQYKLLGNTIPTCLTLAICKVVVQHLAERRRG